MPEKKKTYLKQTLRGFLFPASVARLQNVVLVNIKGGRMNCSIKNMAIGRGISVDVLTLISPEQSVAWNPLILINDKSDLTGNDILT